MTTKTKRGRVSDRLKPLVLLDDDGKRTTAGDTVCFSYGIPPVRALAKIIERNGVLVGICPGHNPDEFKLRSLRRYVGDWYKQNREITSGTSGSSGVGKGG